MEHERTKDAIDRAEQKFLDKARTAQNQQHGRLATRERIVTEKSLILVPVRKLLFRLCKRGIMVTHADRQGAQRHIPQPLACTENESSPTYQPGNSIYIEHPAQLEIAVDNNGPDGVGNLVIRCATRHPLSGSIDGTYADAGAAMNALSDFIAASMVSINDTEG